jgi:hypothetical protein
MGVGCTEDTVNLEPVLLTAPAGAVKRMVRAPLKEPPPASQGAVEEPVAILLAAALRPSKMSSALAASTSCCVLWNWGRKPGEAETVREQEEGAA